MILVLGYRFIRDHPSINRLEGTCWDVEPESERVWPLLGFEKTEYGDLGRLINRDLGTDLDLGNRLELCVGIATRSPICILIVST